MDIITTPAGQYTVPATSIVHNAQASLTDRSPASVVHLTQYDTTMPIIAVALTANGQPYTVPSGAAVNIRMAKPGGTFVYDPALGVTADAQTAYIGTTVQMTTVWGRLNAIVEVVLNGAVAGTGVFVLDIAENPVPEDAIESTSEFLTIQQLAAQVQQAADLVQAQATNLQNVTDNLEAIQNAASNAQAAAQSAQAAAQSAQEAQQAAQHSLGFRTFFSAISPDSNGDLDPSRPMTTAAAQSSWTVKSKGDRIQSVQVNGFTSDGQSGGFHMIERVLTGQEEINYTPGSPGNAIFQLNLSSETAIFQNADQVVVFCSFAIGTSYNNRGSYTHLPFRIYQQDNGVSIRTGDSYAVTLDQFKSMLKAAYSAGNPEKIWYIPADASQATGLHITIQAQGHEYRCEMLELTEALGVGDNVQSNVPSGCDKEYTLSGGPEESWSGNGPNGCWALIGKTFESSPDDQVYPILSTYLQAKSGIDVYNGAEGISFNTAGTLNIKLPGGASPSSYLPGHPLTIYYASSTYTAKNDIPVQLETHANGNVYAHDPVALVAVPYTESDADRTPGTYIVSSQDGTTVSVSLKAFQDGGDAETVGGMTPAQLRQRIDAATLNGQSASQILTSAQTAAQGDIQDATPYLYTATFPASGWPASSPYTQTAPVTPVDNGPAVNASTLLCSGFGVDDTASDYTVQIGLAVDLGRSQNKTFGAGTLTLTVDKKPTSDAKIYFMAKKGGV